MNDEQMQPLLDAWFHDRELTPKDVREGVARVMADVPRIRQQGRWLPFPLFRGKTRTATATDTTDHRLSPVLAANGHAPTVIGRTHTMFSPVKAITAGALVFALGGLLLIAQPFDQQGSAPGAEQGAVTPAVSNFTGTIIQLGALADETSTMRDDGLTQHTGFVGLCRWEASDPRMTGDLTYSTNSLEVIEDVFVSSSTYELANEEGSWLGEATALAAALGDDFDVDMDTVIFTGRDAYDGLTAYVLVDWAPVPATFMGAIFPGPMPEVPEPYVAE